MFAMRAVRLAAVLVPFTLQAQAAKPAIDDAAIAGIFDAANMWDISTGSLAAKNYEAMLKKLNGLSGAEFDKAFLEYEVAYHKAVINAVTNTFLPAIQNAELKAFVVKVAPAFQAHMIAAQQLLTSA